MKVPPGIQHDQSHITGPYKYLMKPNQTDISAP